MDLKRCIGMTMDEWYEEMMSLADDMIVLNQGEIPWQEPKVRYRVYSKAEKDIDEIYDILLDDNDVITDIS